MDRDASIAWARKRVGNKIAQWMEEEELEVSTLITFMKTEDLRQSMPTMSSLQYHQFIKNLEKRTHPSCSGNCIYGQLICVCSDQQRRGHHHKCTEGHGQGSSEPFADAYLG